MLQGYWGLSWIDATVSTWGVVTAAQPAIGTRGNKSYTVCICVNTIDRFHFDQLYRMDNDGELFLSENTSFVNSTPVQRADKKKKRKGRKSIAISSSIEKSEKPEDIFEVKTDPSIRFADNKLLVILNRIDSLLKSWDAEFVSSCKAFNELVLRVIHCTQGRKPQGIHSVTHPIEVILLLREHQECQAYKLYYGYEVEKYFAETQRCLNEMKECGESAQKCVDQLLGLQSLREQVWQRSPKSAPPNVSIPDLLSWPAVIGETQGWLKRTQADHQWRDQVLGDISTYCSTAHKAHAIARLWRHMGHLVRNASPAIMIEELLSLKPTDTRVSSANSPFTGRYSRSMNSPIL